MTYLLLLAIASCGSSGLTTAAPSPSVFYGFHFQGNASADVIALDVSVRCYEAAQTLYVSAPDSYPSPSTVRNRVVNVIIGDFHGSGSYTITESTDNANSVLVWLLDYAGPNDYSVLGRGQSGSVK